jgi:hypothetical protein
MSVWVYDSVKCNALTKKNNPCENFQIENSMFCETHTQSLEPVSKFMFVHTTYADLEDLLDSGSLKTGKKLNVQNYSKMLNEIYIQIIFPNDKISYLANENVNDLTLNKHLFIKPEIITDYSDVLHWSPAWVYGEVIDETLFYNPKYSLKQNLNLWYNRMLYLENYRNSLTRIFSNELVIKIEHGIEFKKYLKAVYLPVDKIEKLMCVTRKISEKYDLPDVQYIYDYLVKNYDPEKTEKFIKHIKKKYRGKFKIITNARTSIIRSKIAKIKIGSIMIPFRKFFSDYVNDSAYWKAYDNYVADPSNYLYFDTKKENICDID